MRWPRAYIHLMLRFADRATELEEIPIEEALLDWTPLYLNLGLGRRTTYDGGTRALKRGETTRATPGCYDDVVR